METIVNFLVVVHSLRWWIAGIVMAFLVILLWADAAPMEPEDETWG